MKIKEYEIKTEKLNRNLTLAHLSDIHDRNIENEIDYLRKIKPDYIFISGDLSNTHLKESKNCIRILEELNDVSKTFYSLGNHEYLFNDEDIDLIKRSGTVLLDDKYVLIDGLVIGGLTSYGVRDYSIENRTRNMKGIPNTSWIKKMNDEKGYKILLNHHPEYYIKYLKDFDLDLILSGHCHGGQIRFFKWGIFAPGQGIFAKYNHGIYDNRLVVSSGMANTVRLVPRFFNPRELVIIKVSGKNDKRVS